MDMEVAGRHALLFDDDAMAAFVNSEDALVEWHSLKIDRYDVRHLLSEPPPSRRRNRSHEPRTSDDPAVEFLIDQERYLDLPSESDQPVLEGEGEEEKPSSSGGYRAVAFSYGNTGDSADQENTDVGMEAREFLPPFSVPRDSVQSLVFQMLGAGMELLCSKPPTEKIHQIIARTAVFVSKHGGQTEIILRVKQGDNPTFGFLMPDHHLHAYFRYLVEHPELLHSEIDEKSQDERKTAGTEHIESGSVEGALSLLGSAYGSGEDEDEGGYDGVNASLPHVTKNMEPVETAANDESLSRKLILSNKDKVPAVKKNSSIIGSKSKSVKAVKKEENSALSSAKDEKLRNHGVGATSKPVLEPPQELKRLIDKLVEFVMRNGRQFEATLLEQDSKLERFPFLLPSDQYHPYYLKSLEAAQESKVNGKISYTGQDDLGGSGISRKASMVKDEFCDVPFESDRKEKFKMVIGKSKKEAQETEKESQESGYTVDAAAAAAILQAASKGIKSSGLRFITSTAPKSHDSAVLKQDDSSNNANMTEEQKLKAERLKRAKMFVAMLKSGALPSRTGTSRGSSAEPLEPGMLKSAPEASSAAQEREGSLAPAVVEKPVDDGNFIERQSERQSKRKYRSRSIGIEDDQDDSHREGHSHRKHRSRSRKLEGDEDEVDRENYLEKGMHGSHSIKENKNGGESSEEKICREEREDKDNNSYSERKYKSRSRSHKEDVKVGKDRKHRRKRHRSHSSSEESDNGEESDGQDTEHTKYRSKHPSRQRDKNECEGMYKEERDKEHRRSYKSRDRRHEGSRKTENAVEKEDRHYRRKRSSHSSSEDSEDELDHHHSKSSRSKHKEDHHKEERDHKRSKKSRHSHHSSSESPSRRKKHRSSHTSHHSKDKHSRHRNEHSSSKDRESRRHHHKHDSSCDDEHKPRTRKESQDLRVELEEGEISPKDEPKATVSGAAKRGTSVDIVPTTEVPADLRAKIRAMLMATRS